MCCSCMKHSWCHNTTMAVLGIYGQACNAFTPWNHATPHNRYRACTKNAVISASWRCQTTMATMHSNWKSMQMQDVHTQHYSMKCIPCALGCIRIWASGVREIRVRITMVFWGKCMYSLPCQPIAPQTTFISVSWGLVRHHIGITLDACLCDRAAQAFRDSFYFI